MLGKWDLLPALKLLAVWHVIHLLSGGVTLMLQRIPVLFFDMRMWLSINTFPKRAARIK